MWFNVTNRVSSARKRGKTGYCQGSVATICHRVKTKERMKRRAGYSPDKHFLLLPIFELSYLV